MEIDISKIKVRFHPFQLKSVRIFEKYDLNQILVKQRKLEVLARNAVSFRKNNLSLRSFNAQNDTNWSFLACT
jgi:hypothetical protein